MIHHEQTFGAASVTSDDSPSSLSVRTSADAAPVPDLPHGCGSWICTTPEGGVREFTLRQNAEIAAGLGWKVETASAYLARINGGVR